MKKIWKKITIAVLAAAMVLPVSIGGFAVDGNGVYVDATGTVGASSINGPEGALAFTDWTNNASLSAGEDGTIQFGASKMAEWKTFFGLQDPSSFPMSGQGVLKFEMQYEVTAADPSLADQIQVNTIFQETSGGQNISLGNGNKHTTANSGVRTDTYYINAATGHMIRMVNGEVDGEAAVTGAQTGDLTAIRFYTVSKATGTDVVDGETELASPVTWHVHYISIQPTTILHASVTDYEDGAINVPVDESIMVRFDAPVAADTLNSDTVVLEAETAEGYVRIPAVVTPNGSGDVTSCQISAEGGMSYMTNYRIAIADGIESNVLSLPVQAESLISFRTEANDLRETITYAENDPVQLTVNGEPTDILATGSVACTVNLTSSEAATARVIAAVYEREANGGMRYVSSAEQVQEISGSVAVTCQVGAIPDDSRYVIRIMVWDENGYPWTNAMEYAMGQQGPVVVQ